MTYIAPLVMLCSVAGGLFLALMADGLADACGAAMVAFPLVFLARQLTR
jgi:hypothetical protein